MSLRRNNRRFILGISSAKAPIPYITTKVFDSSRSDNSGDVGFAFTPNRNITVTSIGRWTFSGNSQTHTVKIYRAGTGSIVSVSVDTTLGVIGAFQYVACTPTVLTSGTQYLCVSSELGPDVWWNMTGMACTSDGSFDGSSYGDVLWTAGTTAYVPVDFLYI